jgi:hypothetical protein
MNLAGNTCNDDDDGESKAVGMSGSLRTLGGGAFKAEGDVSLKAEGDVSLITG